MDPAVAAAMELEVRLLRWGAQGCVVAVRALAAGQLLGEALGQAADAETAEDRALARLLQRLQESGGFATSARGALSPGDPTGRLPSAGGPAAPSGPTLPATPGAAARRREPPRPIPRNSSAADPLRDDDPLLTAELLQAPRHGATGETVQPALPVPEGTVAPPDPPAAVLPAAEQAPENAPAGSRGDRAVDAVDPPEPPPDPEDWSPELAQIDLQLRRLGWSRDDEGIYLHRAYGHPSRSRLTTYADLLAYLRALEDLQPPADPSQAAVPLQRRELLNQCEALLLQLGWDGEQGRRYLEEQLGASSRSQLNDQQLLAFNIQLEEALLARPAP